MMMMIASAYQVLSALHGLHLSLPQGFAGPEARIGTEATYPMSKYFQVINQANKL